MPLTRSLRRAVPIGTRIALLCLVSGSLPACQPCHGWEEVVVDASSSTDPSGGASAADQGIGVFREWTGRETTCVDRVNVVDEVDGPAIGKYISLSHEIQAELVMAESTTVHEFCHALDDEEAGVFASASEAGADVLTPYTLGLNRALYTTESVRVSEAFARFCEQGPQAVALAEDLYAACGIEGSLDALRFVRDIAFPDATTSGWGELDEPFSYESDVEPIPDTEATSRRPGVQSVSGRRGIFVLERYAVDVDTEVVMEPQLLRLDPETHTVAERLTLPAHAVTTFRGNPTDTIYLMLGSSADPILYAFAGDDAGTAWRVVADPLRLEQLDFPVLSPDTLPDGFETDGTLTFRDLDGSLYRSQLATTTLEEVDARGVFGSASQPPALAIFGDASGVLVVFSGSSGPVLVAYDVTGHALWTREVPIPGDRVRSLFRLADGSVVVTVSVPGSWTGGGASVAVSVRFDPSTGRWATMSGVCGALAGENWMYSDEGPVRVDALEQDGTTELQWTRLRQ